MHSHFELVNLIRDHWLSIGQTSQSTKDVDADDIDLSSVRALSSSVVRRLPANDEVTTGESLRSLTYWRTWRLIIAICFTLCLYTATRNIPLQNTESVAPYQGCTWAPDWQDTPNFDLTPYKLLNMKRENTLHVRLVNLFFLAVCHYIYVTKNIR